MKNYYITIMSIDPKSHYGRDKGDYHQKYGLSVQAKDDKDAQEKGVVEFKRRHGNLPIFWVKCIDY